MKRAFVVVAALALAAAATGAGMPALEAPRSSVAHWQLPQSARCTVLFSGSSGGLDRPELITGLNSTLPQLLFVRLPPRASPAVKMTVWFADGTRTTVADDASSPCVAVLPHKPLSHVAIAASSPGVRLVARSDSGAPGPASAADCGWANLSSCVVAPPPRSAELETRPFFLSASRTPEAQEISLVAILPASALSYLELLASVADGTLPRAQQRVWGRLLTRLERLPGPVSAVVAVSSDKQVRDVVEMYLRDLRARLNVDVHLVYDPEGAFPAYSLMEVGLRNSRTDLVMFLPYGASPPSGVNAILASTRESLARGDGNELYFAPVFGPKEGSELKHVPRSKSELVEGLNGNAYRLAAERFPLDAWLAEDKPVALAVEQAAGVPFVCRRSVVMPTEWLDGCEYDQQAHLKLLQSRGYKFYSAPGGFVVRVLERMQLSEFCSSSIENEWSRKAVRMAKEHAELELNSRWWDSGRKAVSCGPRPAGLEGTRVAAPGPALPPDDDRQEDKADVPEKTLDDADLEERRDRLRYAIVLHGSRNRYLRIVGRTLAAAAIVLTAVALLLWRRTRAASLRTHHRHSLPF
eukprot:m51a1_g1487 hypothetical protein (581) ;mRNA; r:310127-312671